MKAHLADPGLSVDAVALALNYSRRPWLGEAGYRVGGQSFVVDAR